MRDLFTAYYKPTEQEFKELWDTCIFAFDANVLLNIYRYSQATREAFLNVLRLLKDRVWLPYQAAYEYQENRLNVLSEQFKAYDDIPKRLESALAAIKGSYFRHPFIDVSQVTSSLEKTIGEIKSSLDKARAAHPDLTESDELREALTEIFDGKVGEPYKEDVLNKIYQEGEKRFQKQMPPGYKDSSKDGNRKYGDLILWHQLKEHAKSAGKPIILITDDRKEDWWQEHSGKTVGPRPELVQEMKSEANVNFYMYQSDRFIGYAQKFLGLAGDKALEEVRDVREKDEAIDNALKNIYEKPTLDVVLRIKVLWMWLTDIERMLGYSKGDTQLLQSIDQRIREARQVLVDTYRLQLSDDDIDSLLGLKIRLDSLQNTVVMLLHDSKNAR